jgi:hypothetical protein
MSAASDGLELRLGSRPVRTVFDLLGVRENDLTYSMGWALSRSPALMKHFTALVLPGQRTRPVSVDLQKSSDHGGYTDIEIRYEDAHVIVEAKRGWALPTLVQLCRYRPRLRDHKHDALVVISEATSTYAGAWLPGELDRVPLRHVAWRQVISLTEQSAAASRSMAE